MFESTGFELKLFYLFIPYALFLLFFAVYSLITAYHLRRFGTDRKEVSTLLLIYGGVSGLILLVSFIWFLQYSWSLPINFDSFFSSTPNETFFSL